MKRCVPSIILAVVALASPSRLALAGDADPWMTRYDGGLLPAYSAVWHYAIPAGQQRHMLASDSSGALYVAATAYTDYVATSNAMVAKLSREGDLLWARLLPASASVADSLVLDGSETVRVLAEGTEGLMVVAYDPGGVLRWQRQEPGADLKGRIAVDAAGNTFLAYSGAWWEDAVLRKLDPQGSVLWSRRLDPEVRDVAVDEAGDVFVESGPFDGWSVIEKYNGSGSQVWSSPASPSWDSQLVPSPDGSVYRATLHGSEGASVARYEADGMLGWSALLAPGAYLAEMALAATPSGGLVASTGSWRSTGEFITQALEPNGSVLWESSFSPPSSEAAYGWVRGVEVDAAGHAYVALTSWGIVGGDGWGPHGWVVKYDGEGKEKWLAHQPGAYAATMAPPRNGRVTFAGQTGDRKATVLRSYDMASGAEVMAANPVATAPASDRPGAGFDPPERSLSSDAAGNVFVVGRSYGADASRSVALKYNGGGAQEWAVIGSVPLSATLPDGAGGVVVGGTEKRGSGGTYVPPEAGSIYLARYDSAGAPIWELRYPPVESRNARGLFQAMATDAGQNIYVTGIVERRRTAPGGGQLAEGVESLLKFDAGGSLLWAREKPLSFASSPLMALDVDGSGTARVVGGTTARTYDSAGNLQWEAPWSFYPGAVAVGHDDQGATYAVGAIPPSLDGDMVTVKFDAQGTEVWRRFFGGPANGKDRPVGLQVSPDGHVWVAGTSDSGPETSDYVTLRYDQAGALLWAARYDGGPRDEARALVVDPNGNAYVTGSSPSAPDEWSLRPAWATLKYDSGGTVQWVERGMEGTGVYGAEAIALTSSGQVVVAGQATFPDTGLDIVTIGYSQDGSAQAPGARPGPRVEPAVENELEAALPDEKRPPRKHLAGQYDRAPVETPDE